MLKLAINIHTFRSVTLSGKKYCNEMITRNFRILFINHLIYLRMITKIVKWIGWSLSAYNGHVFNT